MFSLESKWTNYFVITKRCYLQKFRPYIFNEFMECMCMDFRHIECVSLHSVLDVSL